MLSDTYQSNGYINFTYSVYSFNNLFNFTFYMDGTPLLLVTNLTVAPVSVSFPVSAGPHIFSWATRSADPLAGCYANIYRVSEIGNTLASLSCIPCPAGTYSDLTFSTCLACPAGTFGNAAASGCQICPPGQFSYSGWTECVSTPNCSTDDFWVYKTPCVGGSQVGYPLPLGFSN